MGKLVRDLIPEIIAKEGRIARFRTLTEHEYRFALLDKLVEEANEVRSAGPDQLLHELADLAEVLSAIRTAYEISEREIHEVADAKRSQRGGFSKRLYLEV